MTPSEFILGFFKALGLAPFRVKKSSGSKLLKKLDRQGSAPIHVVTSRLGCLYNLILIALQFRMLVIALPREYDFEYTDITRLTATLATIQSVLHNFIFFLNLLMFAFRQKTAVKLFNRLMSLDDTTFNRNDDFFDRSRSFFLMVFFISILLWTVTLVTQYFGYPASVLTWFRSIVPFFVTNCFEIQYIFVVKVIEKRFSDLNRALLENPDSSSVEFETKLFLTRNLLTPDSYWRKMNSIRRTHTNLYEISLEISDFYSVPILFSVAGGSYTALYVCYYMVVPFFAPVGKESYWIISNCTCWLIIIMLPITLLASGVTNVTKEMNNTANIVKKLLARSTISRYNAYELKQFATDMLHRNIEFTACGFFPLDCSLVYSIFTMVCGYLIILIQFQIGNYGNDSQNEKHNNSVRTITESSNL